ncbi:MAG: hypothetical protein LBV69_05020 [Bacteroidales bacterium]|jgi:hypothetical protein|nr:hypothetical protein [Bacteroidales bacterium]
MYLFSHRTNKQKINLYVFAIIFNFLFLNVNFGFCQDANTYITLQKDTILIGEQFKIDIIAKTIKPNQIIFQNFKDTLSKNVEIIKNLKSTKKEFSDSTSFYKSLIITSFDTGRIVIPQIPFHLIKNNDTINYLTKESFIYVKPYVLLDTIPVDTSYSHFAGFVIRGHDGLKKEIDQNIPDSVKQSISVDSLQNLQNAIKEQLVNMLSSQITQKTGLYDEKKILEIIDAPENNLYIADKSGTLEEFHVLGNVDTLFVKEFDNVDKNQALFTSYRIKDIVENLYNTPYNFSEFLFDMKRFFAFTWWIFLLIGLIIGAIFIIKNLKKKKVNNLPIIKKKQIPAHVIALEKLNTIRLEKLWSKGYYKEYHVQLSDTIREYIENRFQINVTDMTTTEILSIFSTSKIIDETNFNRLKFILQVADTVKFAKYEPLPLENDNCLNNSFDLVNDTKINSDNFEKDSSEENSQTTEKTEKNDD